MKKIKIACVVGTRPEIIKMAVLFHYLKKHCDWAEPVLINTAQHRNLLDDMLEVFDLTPDIDLNVMVEDQSLGYLTAELCYKLTDVFQKLPCDVVLSAGDTSTVMLSALIAFYFQIPYGHVEAGLRTDHRNNPFPEEMHRLLTAQLSQWHFAPTQAEKLNLIKENINEKNIFVTGNPVIDALHWVLENRKVNKKHNGGRFVLVTIHRRENFGNNLANFIAAIKTLCKKYPDLKFVFPVHPNPKVKKTVYAELEGIKQVQLLEPLKYDEFIHLMQDCYLVMTDSGGLQEEAPALKKPLVILRDTTERHAVIDLELAILAGVDELSVVDAVSYILDNPQVYKSMARGLSPYGDGLSARHIALIIEEKIKQLKKNDNRN